MLTAGNVHDAVVAERLLSRVSLKGTTVLANKAYDKWAQREFIADFCIPPRDNEADPWYVAWRLYRESHLLKLFSFFVLHQEVQGVILCVLDIRFEPFVVCLQSLIIQPSLVILSLEECD